MTTVSHFGKSEDRTCYRRVILFINYLFVTTVTPRGRDGSPTFSKAWGVTPTHRFYSNYAVFD